MKELLLQEKWRPKTLDDVIVLDRIKNLIENNPKNNYLFHGSFGTGKTTLARILVGRYSKRNPYIELNTSLFTSIETLRTTIDEFCSKVYMGLDMDKDFDSNETKFVLLDEFERASAQFQDALKVYIEEYSTKNVRFILVTNHISKVSPGIRSRMIEVDFDCKSVDEERELKIKVYKRINDVILPKENMSISKDDLVTIIKKDFPDFRSIIMSVDVFIKTGEQKTKSFQPNHKIKEETYNLVLNNSSFDDIYHFLMNNYGADGIHNLINLFGKEFIEWVYDTSPNKTERLFKVCDLVCHYNSILEEQADPLVCGISFIGKVREALK
jgi:DNA polymerase III delta prime subunit